MAFLRGGHQPGERKKKDLKHREAGAALVPKLWTRLDFLKVLSLMTSQGRT